MLSKPRRHADGDRLYLQISKTGAKGWVFHYSFADRHREAGLGPLRFVSLSQAREKATEYRCMIASGIDPPDARETGIKFSKLGYQTRDGYQHLTLTQAQSTACIASETEHSRVVPRLQRWHWQENGNDHNSPHKR
jgi:hypothetical protein